MGLTKLDCCVLLGYFILTLVIGVFSMIFVKKQEDYFLGSRSFGKIFQMFAAFGAGTNASDPIVTAKTTYTNGLSGVWSGLLWLFVTPFYWICGVWYRRMRCITLGDWFTERYQSKGLAFAYMLFGAVFYMCYLGVGMTAIGKMGAPLIGSDFITILGHSFPFDKFIIIITSMSVLFYGVLGGLRAAYWTDLIQGILIILLSVVLIPVGLNALVQDEYRTNQVIQETITASESSLSSSPQDVLSPKNQTGFQILHQRVPTEYFNILTSPKGGEFPLHYIIAITLLNLVGIVCQPHFIATGGGSAKTEFNARFGLVAGNVLKRFCTIGWAFTALIALAYLASNQELATDPDKVWGIATRELLGPLNMGLVGLMLACLFAALMSSASCYMLVVSGLVVRNGYVALINPNASEKTCVLAGRICGAFVIIGATVNSLLSMNVFEQLKFAWEIPIIFAAPFWVGMYWRRANKHAAWITCVVTLLLFFMIPSGIPKLIPSIVSDSRFLQTNEFVVTCETRSASITDVERRNAQIADWEEKASSIRSQSDKLPSSGSELDSIIFTRLGSKPQSISLGDKITDEFKTGGKAIFWHDGVIPYDKDGNELVFNSKGNVIAKVCQGQKHYVSPHENEINLFDSYKASVEKIGDSRVLYVNRLKSPEMLASEGIYLKGQGSFEIDFLLYQKLGLDLTGQSNGTLETLRLPTRLFFPFLFLILISLVTPRGNSDSLDRYFVKMKTPVDPDPLKDAEEMALSYANPHRFDHKRLIKRWGLEINKPTKLDIFGFTLCLLVCISLVWLIVAIANFQG